MQQRKTGTCIFDHALNGSSHGKKNNNPKRNALVREAPATNNVDGRATGASESTMACDTGLVEPAPLR